MEDLDSFDYSGGDDSFDVGSSDTESSDTADFSASDEIDTESIDTDSEIETLDFSDDDPIDTADDIADAEEIDTLESAEDIEPLEIDSESEMDESSFDESDITPLDTELDETGDISDADINSELSDTDAEDADTGMTDFEPESLETDEILDETGDISDTDISSELSDTDAEDIDTDTTDIQPESLETDEIPDEEIEVLETDDLSEVPDNESAEAAEEIPELELDSGNEEQLENGFSEEADIEDGAIQDIPEINNELPGSNPDPLDYEEAPDETGNEDLETEQVSEFPSSEIIDDTALDIPELEIDTPDTENQVDTGLPDYEVSGDSDLSEINNELPGSYSNPLDYDEKPDEEGIEGLEPLETDEDNELPPTEVIDDTTMDDPELEADSNVENLQPAADLQDNVNDGNIYDINNELPGQIEIEEETEERDRPKTLVREITPEILESRRADMEEVLDNYRDNLRNRGVDENRIESFVQGEREKMEREYESLDRGDEDLYIYHTPTDWQAVADSLGYSENSDLTDIQEEVSEGSEQELPEDFLPLDEMPSDQELPDADETSEDDINDQLSDLTDESLDEQTEAPEDVNEEEQKPIDVNDIDYDAVFQEMEPEQLQEGYRDVELDEDPEQYTAVLEPFEENTWEGLTLDDRKEAMEEMADFIGEKIHLENPPRIEYYYNEQKGDYGGYRPSDNVLCVNEYMLYEADEAADTIAHELWHAHQHECADNPQTERDYQYQYNFQNYIKPKISPERYRSQLVEAEAYAFASQIKTKLKDIGRMRG